MAQTQDSVLNKQALAFSTAHKDEKRVLKSGVGGESNLKWEDRWRGTGGVGWVLEGKGPKSPGPSLKSGGLL